MMTQYYVELFSLDRDGRSSDSLGTITTSDLPTALAAMADRIDVPNDGYQAIFQITVAGLSHD